MLSHNQSQRRTGNQYIICIPIVINVKLHFLCRYDLAETNLNVAPAGHLLVRQKTF